MTDFAEEAKSRWGSTPEFQESSKRTAKYSPAEFQAAKVDQEAATELFVYAFGNGLPVTSPKAREAVIAHRQAISKWFYECSIDMQKQLAVMYISDKRFKEYYDGRVRGLAQYVHDAIQAQ
jgi:TipAS antibiotic-recognition domain